MQLKKYTIYFFVLLMVACTPKEKNFENQVVVSQSKPIIISSQKDKNPSVYVTSGDTHNKDLQNAVNQHLRQKSFKIAKSPSLAKYIVHIAVPSIGTFNTEQLQTIVKAGYGKTATPKSHESHTEKKMAMVVDVLIVARNIPAKVNNRPDVVSTTSKPSKIAEDSSRIVAAVPASDDFTFNEVKANLVQEIAKKIAASIP